MKAIKYIKTAVFVLTALGVVDFMTRMGLDVAGRYQYKDFGNPTLFRTLADIILLTACIFLAARQWTQKNIGLLYWTASLTFIVLLVPDIASWLYLTDFNPIYYYILTVFSLAILIILYDFSTNMNINFKFLLIGGLLFIASGFVYDIVVINIPYQDPTDEIIDKQISNQKTLYWIYYIGLLLKITGLTRLITRKIKTTRPNIGYRQAGGE